MSVELIERAAGHGQRPAVADAHGLHSYDDLIAASARAAGALLHDAADLNGARVAYMIAPGVAHAAMLCAIWRAGGVGVPLASSHPEPELVHVLADTGASLVVADPANEQGLRRLATAHGARLVVTADAFAAQPPRAWPAVTPEHQALILYTSGTTSRPKGVVITHANLEAQIRSLVQAWEWQSSDRILHVLPLHHVHGIVNVLLCALWAGATCEFASFDAQRVWSRFRNGGLTLFMAVPTIYVKLIAAYEQATAAEQRVLSAAGRNFRLMVSGSAALPVTTFDRWRALSGHTLLERYGMTEIGMALSNPLHGERRAGTVGQPLPGVEVRLVAEAGHLIEGEAVAGEIQVRGPGVFAEYWRQPEATRAAFVDGGWFRTGDVAVIEDGYYRILGRSSIDIIKTGGYKVSALEIEEALRTHPAVRDCAVVGADDDVWGECICAAVVTDEEAFESALAKWLAERLAPYKLPRRWLRVSDLPRNAMGKVTKPEVKRLFS